jgi:hypothetical protein
MEGMNASGVGRKDREKIRSKINYLTGKVDTKKICKRCRSKYVCSYQIDDVVSVS